METQFLFSPQRHFAPHVGRGGGGPVRIGGPFGEGGGGEESEEEEAIDFGGYYSSAVAASEQQQEVA